MSLEVDGRPGSVAIPYPRESEGFKYINGKAPNENSYNAQNSYLAGTIEEHAPIEPKQLSDPKDLGHGGRVLVRVRKGYIVSVAVIFALVSVLAIVAAGVAGSVAARRGKHIDAWFVLFIQI